MRGIDVLITEEYRLHLPAQAFSAEAPKWSSPAATRFPSHQTGTLCAFRGRILSFSQPLSITFYVYYHRYAQKVNKKDFFAKSKIPFYALCYAIERVLSMSRKGINEICKKIGAPKHPYFLNPLAKSAVLVYNHHRSRRIIACPTVVQSETNNQFKNQTDYRLFSIGSRG